jgi:tetratricopeptide (TPR) repeat protein
MRSLRYLIAVVISLLVSNAAAQIHGGSAMNPGAGDVKIRVILGNDRSAGPTLLIQLMQGSSDAVVSTTYTNDIGEAHFIGVPIGVYHVEVSGDGIANTRSDTFEVDSRKMSQTQYITVRRVEDTGPKPVSGESSMVSASDLNVPPKARKEVDKANEAMALHNWKKALEHLNQAIALAPQYATAFNNLGVLYAKMNDIPHEEEALKKAVAVDDHFAPALVNYGKLCLSQKNPAQAEPLLQKAATAEPTNQETLMLLSYSAYLNRHFDAAIFSAIQAHSSGRDHPAFVHYIAGRAYQQQNQQPQALAEFQKFLQEEPDGPRAARVRADVAKIQSGSQEARTEQFREPD